MCMYTWESASKPCVENGKNKYRVLTITLVEQSCIRGWKIRFVKREKFRGISINISTAMSDVCNASLSLLACYLCTFNIYIYISAVVKYFVYRVTVERSRTFMRVRELSDASTRIVSRTSKRFEVVSSSLGRAKLSWGYVKITGNF